MTFFWMFDSYRQSILKITPTNIKITKYPIVEMIEYQLKARLHGRFLLRFSPFGGCEGVDYLMMLL